MRAVAAVFDIDGTLVTFEFDVAGTRRALIEKMKTRGFETDGLGLRTPTQKILDYAKSQIESGTVKADFVELKGSLFSILDEFEAREADSTSLFPKTVETLQRLGSEGVRLAVLTNSGRKAASAVLQRCQIDRFFEFVLTRDDVPKMKPSPDGLKMLPSRMDLSAGSVFYVGDSLYDIDASKLAGIRMVAVASGNYTMDALRAGGAERVVADISEVPGAIGV